MLYLHIGTSKAGSTTIQEYLQQTDTASFGLGQLATFGLGNARLLAAAADTRNARKYWVENRGHMTAKEFETNRDRLWTSLADELEDMDSADFVASSEYLYRHYFNEPDALAELRDRLLNYFGDVRIILYLRDQRSYLRSLYAQTVVGAERSTKDFTDFFQKCRTAQALWNYRSGVALWLKVFGTERVTVIPFNQQNFHEGDLIKDFLFRISPQLAERHMPENIITPRNVSPGYPTIRAIRLLNSLEMRTGALAARAFLKLADSPLGRHFCGSKFETDHDDEILELVSDGNSWLNANLLSEFPVKLPVSDTSK